MNLSSLLEKALRLEFLTLEEGIFLYQNAELPQLMDVANKIRFQLHPNKEVTWIIDRNVNYTNVCYSTCKFCNFHCSIKSDKAYITTREEYKEKIDLLFQLDGNQILLQGGMHPKLGLDFYADLFKSLKKDFPNLKLHSLGPPEIVHIAKKEGISVQETLQHLVNAGLDSLPGAGAEVLSNRVRKILSPAKCSVEEWLNVMKEAHKMDLITSATMMFGHIETLEERFLHLIYLREIQAQKQEKSRGFLSFILWPLQAENTQLKELFPEIKKVSALEYIKMLAISRIMLPNISNIQASWLTVGKQTAQICLHGGANDFGSIMIEENVVSQAGANYQFDSQGIQKAIQEAGFKAVRRNQNFESL